MKKINIQLVFILLIGFVAIKVLPPGQWNILVYLLFCLLLLFNILNVLFKFFRTKRGVYSYGNIVGEGDNNNLADGYSKKIIEFISPIDSRKYRIEHIVEKGIGSKVDSEKIKIWVNPKKPDHSIVVEEIGSSLALSIFTQLLFFIIFLMLLIYNVVV